MSATVRIDLPMCQGHGRCYSLEPDLIDADDEGMPLLTSTEPIETARARGLADCCPEFAITVEEV